MTCLTRSCCWPAESDRRWTPRLSHSNPLGPRWTHSRRCGRRQSGALRTVPRPGCLHSSGGSGPADAARTAPGPLPKAEKEIGLLGLVSHRTHVTLQRVRGYLLGGAAVLALLVAYFSAGFGRLVSLGCVLLFGSLPGAVVAAAQSAKTTQPVGGANVSIGSFLGAYVVPEIAPVFARTFTWALLVAAGLIAAALLGSSIAARLIRRWRPAPGAAAGRNAA